MGQWHVPTHGTLAAGVRRLSGGLAAHQRFVFAALAFVILLDGAWYWLQVATTPGLAAKYAGVDYSLYMGVTRRWLSGGPFYDAYQLAGPYSISAGDILYPPIALILFVPFTVLPPFLWWLAPLAGTAFAVMRLRPAAVSWPLLACCAWWATSGLKVLTGNPVMWAMAALSFGALYGWPSTLVALKPSVFPFALLGMWRRSWWLALGCLGLAAIPFGSMWSDWLTAVVNSRGGGLFYSAMEVPMLVLPLAAWLASPFGPLVGKPHTLRASAKSSPAGDAP